MNTFRAAAAAVDLVPPAGCWLTGFAARPIPSDGQHDPILARALLLDDGASKLAIVACDLIGIDARTIAALRARIAEQSSIPAGSIVFSCTHTHAAPATLRFRGVLGYVNDTWWRGAQDEIVALVAGLEKQLAPARLGTGSIKLDGISYNRQEQTRPFDTELLCIGIDALSGGSIATLINFAVHPVTLSYKNLKVSGDVPGHAAARVSALRGGVSLYLQGACGDVNPASDLRSGWGNGTFDDVAEFGEKLALGALQALQQAEWTVHVHLNCAHTQIDLPLDVAPQPVAIEAMFGTFETDLRRARAEGHLMNEGIALAWLRWLGELKGAIVNGALPSTHPMEVWAAAINDLRLAAVPLEPYSDIGLSFKRAVQPFTGMFLGYANGLIGYCATDWAKDQGGYGPNDSCRWFPEQLTPIGYGAAQLVADACAKLARSL